MKNISRHIGKLEIIGRMPSSTNGNPRYKLSVNGVTCCTAVDTMLAYGITNYAGQMVEATIGTHYGVATLNSVALLKGE